MRLRPFIYIFSAFLIASAIFTDNSVAQNKSEIYNFRSPVDIDIFLSGNFAEVRSNHFHSGIDIKTNGQTGEQIFATEKGYVSRIKIEPGGYGKAIYMKHPNGFTSVYGHLRELDKKIADYVKKQQYKKESFRVDLFPPAEMFEYERGDVIALSGNSGSSMGPHLHFEIRDSQTENPVNPLLFPFKVADNRPPVIYSINLYSLSGRKELRKPKSFKTYGSDGKYRLGSNEVIKVNETFGVGIETLDFLNGSSNKCGVFDIKMFMDGELLFNSRTDEFSFAESRYINSFIDYAEYQRKRSSTYKTFVDPNNHLSVLQFAKNKGLIKLEDDEAHKIHFQISDVAGNLSEIEFRVKKDTSKLDKEIEETPFYNSYFHYSEKNTFVDDNIKINIPAKALYNSLYFSYESGEAPHEAYSRLHKIHNDEVPLHKSYSLAIKPDSLPNELKKYALIARIGGNYNSSIGGKWEDDYLVSSTRSFGDYAIMIDSTPPVIRPRNFTNGTDVLKSKQIRFTVKDDFSGISSYRGELDGKWILFEWDPKNNLLFHDIDPNILNSSAPHKLEITVIDGRNNTGKYSIDIK